MDDLHVLADLLKTRNEIGDRIADHIGRPAQVGHLGEYIASKVFNISLAESASQKGIDGHFVGGPLDGLSVNVKWYPKREGLLDMNSDASPDFYLVLAGPKVAAASSRGETRPWIIRTVHLFHAGELVRKLRERPVKIGIATSVAQQYWEDAEIYPRRRDDLYPMTDKQRSLLALFG